MNDTERKEGETESGKSLKKKNSVMTERALAFWWQG